MSLLEDIFLQDEAGEAEELERVIEGDDDEQIRPLDNSDDDSEKEDEAEEEKRRVDPTQKERRVIKNPRFILNPARLTGPRGIQVIPDHFKDFKFKGKGHEREDLDLVLKKLEHWAYRLYPKFQFQDCLKKIETLGKKRPVMVHLHKIRTDQFLSEETVVQKDSSDDETPVVQEEDEFDKLLQQQIELARSTPAPASARKAFRSPPADRSPITMPKATSSPSISNDQRERMLKNRQKAEERRLAKLTQTKIDVPEINLVNNTDATNINEVPRPLNTEVTKKHNRSQIDSSGDESDVVSVNQSISVDVHIPKDCGSTEICVNTQQSDIEQEEINKDGSTVIDAEEKSHLDAKNNQNSEHITVVNINDINNKKSVFDIDENSATKEICDKNSNVDTNNDKSIEEDVMEVDFSDDF